MKRATIFALGVAAIASGAAAVAIYANWNTFVPIAAMGINYLRYLNAPAGTLMVETAPGFDGANPAAAARSPPPDDGLWPSYNKTLDSNRFSSLTEINRENAGRLKVLCTYDTHQYTGFNSGLLMVDGALLFATDHDTYSIDPITCGEKWHKHEAYAPATPQAVNRGVAFSTGACSAARRTAGCSPMTSRAANGCGKRRSRTPRRARARPRPRSPGTISSSSATPEAISKA